MDQVIKDIKVKLPVKSTAHHTLVGSKPYAIAPHNLTDTLTSTTKDPLCTLCNGWLIASTMSSTESEFPLTITAATETDTSTVALTDVKDQLDEPKMHRVVLHNDDYTPMEFVVAILESYFNKSEPQATQIMFDVHKKGLGICGVFTKEIAETKTVMVTEKAKMHKYPLRCTHEEESS